MVRQQLTHLVTVMRRMQDDPTPTSETVQVQVPRTPTPEGVDQIALPPTPTVTPRVSPTPRDVTPTPTSTVQISAPGEETPTQSPTPTPTQHPPSPTPVQAEEQPVQDEPATLDLFNPLCGPGPFHPWYPIVAPPEVTSLSGIRWYGLQHDPESNTLIAAAFLQDGGEVSRGEMNQDSDGVYRWSLSDGETRIEASFAVERDGAGGRIAGDIAGQPFTLSVGGNDPPVLDMDPALALGDAEQRLMGQWEAVVPKFAGLFELLASGGDAATGSEGKCFAAGFLLAPAAACCLGSGICCVGTGIVGGYLFTNC